jgi:type I restriction enzyme S subunit
MSNKSILWELPPEWRWVKIGDISEVSTGGTPDTNHPEYYGGDIRWLKSGDIKGDYIDQIPNRITLQGLNNSNARVHPEGTVMLAMSGQGKTRGTSAILKVSSACSQSVAAILPSVYAIPEIIHYALVNRYDETRLITGENERSGLNLRLVREISFPLPPLLEQQRIASLLKEQLATVDQARLAAQARLDAAKALPAAFLRQVFPQPGQPLPSGWSWVKLGELFDITSSKRVFESDWKSEGVPFYRAREIVELSQKGFVDNKIFISEDMFCEYSSRYGIPREGDIMVTGVGTLGICYVVRESDRFYFKDGNILWLKSKGNSDPRFIEFAFKTDYLLNQIKDSAGTTVGTFTIVKAKNTLIPLPMIQEQQMIVANMNKQMTAIDKARNAAQAELDMINALPAALLLRAFNGEL